MMTLSWADRRLGALEDEVVSLPPSGTGDAPVANGDLHAVWPADRADVSTAGANTVEPVEPWEAAWKRSLRMQRALRERQYCEQIRDAKADGRMPLSADEFFSRPTT